jgi:hypothetical protein
MPAAALPVPTQDLSTRAADIPEGALSFEERWSAWLARGAAHDRAVHRRIMFALPTFAVVAAVLYVLLLR